MLEAPNSAADFYLLLTAPRDNGDSLEMPPTAPNSVLQGPPSLELYCTSFCVLDLETMGLLESLSEDPHLGNGFDEGGVVMGK